MAETPRHAILSNEVPDESPWARTKVFVPYWVGHGAVYCVSKLDQLRQPMAPLQKGDIVPGEVMEGMPPAGFQKIHVEVTGEEEKEHLDVSVQKGTMLLAPGVVPYDFIALPEEVNLGGVVEEEEAAEVMGESDSESESD